jgi:hypothetical protein
MSVQRSAHPCHWEEASAEACLCVQQMEKDNANTLKTLDKIPGQNNLKATYSQMLTQSKRKLKMAGCD